jgi:SAM-dependent methyltransferase
MDRLQKLLVSIDKSMKILEIGPSYNPIVSKSDGWNVLSVDHTDQEGLQAKYRSDPTVDVNRIELVDFIWESSDLDVVIPLEHHGTFDACIASHIIEHMPNPIGFYQSLEKLIRPTGVVALAVPDKRFCFDYFRQLSITSDFILAHSFNRRRHSKKTAFDQAAYSVSSDNTGAWAQHPVGELIFYDTLSEAYHLLTTLDETESVPYVDFHAWCYTPFSFKLVMLELNVLELVNWVIDVDFPTDGCEFIVVLKKGRIAFSSDSALQEARKALLQGILADVAAQYDYLRTAHAVPAEVAPQPVAVACFDALTGKMAALEGEHMALTGKMAALEGEHMALTGKMAALEGEHMALTGKLQRQEERLVKIWKMSKLMRKILRPVQVIVRASRVVRQH